MSDNSDKIYIIIILCMVGFFIYWYQSSKNNYCPLCRRPFIINNISQHDNNISDQTKKKTKKKQKKQKQQKEDEQSNISLDSLNFEDHEHSEYNKDNIRISKILRSNDKINMNLKENKNDEESSESIDSIDM